MKLSASSHLTQGYSPEVASQIRKTHVGMASWAATGPFGATCRECQHYGCWKQTRNACGDVVKTVFHACCCGMFKQLTGQLGARIPPQAEACRHFVRREEK
jgi:ribosomal protein L40E